MSAREIITGAIPCNIVYGRAQAADEILNALTAAGYRILAPGQLDDFTREQAAKIAEGWETNAADQDYMTCGNGKFWDAGTIYDLGRADAAAAIRAMGEKL